MSQDFLKSSSSLRKSSNTRKLPVSIQMLFSLYTIPDTQHKRLKILGNSQENHISSFTRKDQPYPPLPLNRSNTFQERLTRQIDQRFQSTILGGSERSSRVKSMSSFIDYQESTPKCLKGVVQDHSKIQKLEKELRELQQDLYSLNINLKLPYNLGFINEKVYELCKDPHLNLVDENEPLPEKIYSLSDLKVLTREVVKKVIKYHGIKQRIDYLIQSLSENDHYHQNHVVLDKPSKKPSFPVRFEKQRGRSPLAIVRVYPEKEALPPKVIKKQSEKEEMRRTFQSDELRKTHNFESYTERNFILLKPSRSLRSSPRRMKSIS